MNESANSNQGVSGRAVGTTLGIGAGVALTGGGILMGVKGVGKVGRGIKRGGSSIGRGIKKGGGKVGSGIGKGIAAISKMR